MAKIKIEDIVFWILIATIIAIIIWKVFGSPTDVATYLSIAALMSAIIVAIWKGIYKLENKVNTKINSLDNKTSLGFMKVKNDLGHIRNDLSYLKDDLREIKTLIKKKK